MMYKLLMQDGQNIFVLRIPRPSASTERLHMVSPEGQDYLKRSNGICLWIYAPGLISIRRIFGGCRGSWADFKYSL